MNSSIPNMKRQKRKITRYDLISEMVTKYDADLIELDKMSNTALVQLYRMNRSMEKKFEETVMMELDNG